MTMPNKNLAGVNWNQAAGEAFLLLLGVLLALGAQAWWEARVERDTTDDYVANLLVEVRENQLDLQRTLETYENSIKASTALIQGIQNGEFEGASTSLQEHLLGLANFSDFRPAISALENLLGAGGLALLESTELQLAVSKYAQKVDDHNVLQAEFVDFVLNTIHPFLGDHVPLLAIRFVTKVPELQTESQVEYDPLPMVTSMQFENMVLRRISAEVDARDYALALLDAANELAPLLQGKN